MILFLVLRMTADTEARGEEDILSYVSTRQDFETVLLRLIALLAILASYHLQHVRWS